VFFFLSFFFWGGFFFGMRAIDLVARLRPRASIGAGGDELCGTTACLIEDIVEQIVGEIDDEPDSDEPPGIVRQADQFLHRRRARQPRRRPFRDGEEFRPGEAGEEVEKLGGYLVTHCRRGWPVARRVISGPAISKIEVMDADPRRWSSVCASARQGAKGSSATARAGRSEAASG